MRDGLITMACSRATSTDQSGKSPMHSRRAPSFERVVERVAFAADLADLQAEPDHIVVHEGWRLAAARR
jgi:hypothetical protein